jgi:hypothetical integral membrane protein (TIGR02206 family)
VTTLAADAKFQAFSGQHWLLLGIFAVGMILFPLWGRSHRGTPREQAACRGFAITLGTAAATMQVYYVFEPGGFDLDGSLPLELCDLAEYSAIIALWTRSERATAFTYYVALTLSIQAILTPSLGQTFPSPRFLGFWTLHLLVVWAAAYLTWGLGFRPTWRLYGFTCAVTLIWAGAAFFLNRALGTNYGYLNHKPSAASLLDLLGPWPWYVLAATAIVAVGWGLLLTLPWHLGKRRSGPAASAQAVP